jgi:hypothetical protein
MSTRPPVRTAKTLLEELSSARTRKLSPLSARSVKVTAGSAQLTSMLPS